MILSAVSEEDNDKRASAAAAGDTTAKSQATTPVTPVPGKRTLNNVKTMFYVGTEVR